MNAKFFLINSFCSLLLSSVAFSSQAGSDTLLLTITGEVLSQPCVLKPGDESIKVDMSTITDSDLARDKIGPTKPFQIHLEKCNESVAKSVKVTFSGTPAAGDAAVLALAPTSEAKGIGIGLREKDNTELPINRASRPININNGNTTLDFGTYVKLLSLADLKPGKFSATANFKLEYE
ncbi:fimbrial protein [Aeromonas hydrophila]|uniref:fimbrial protein n=1 Tax=Aeromonas hydrophila TaxID=644 RepID=UPI001F625E01|nr:fimbrial protein [Aeromonas hydrophila]UNU27986.1 fimbrial protein [Aeromonas hydrophila]